MKFPWGPEYGRVVVCLQVHRGHSDQFPHDICQHQWRGRQWPGQDIGPLLQGLVPDWRGRRHSLWFAPVWLTKRRGIVRKTHRHSTTTRGGGVCSNYFFFLCVLFFSPTTEWAIKRGRVHMGKFSPGSYSLQGLSAGTQQFFQVFSSEWFSVMHHLLMFAKFGFQFSVLNPGKKYQIQMNTLNETWKRFGANSGQISGTYSGHTVFRLIVWLARSKCTSTLIHLHVPFPWPFHHGFWTNLILFNKKIVQKWFFFVFWPVLVSIELLPMIKKRIFQN